MKKYAILGPRLRVFRVIESETEPKAQRFEEITEDQAQTINEGQSAFFLIGGELTPAQEHVRNHRWNEETGEWDVYVPPAPTSIPKHKFMGQLAKETLQGQNEQLKQQLIALGNPEDLLVELVIASDALPADQIPLAIVEIKLTDNIEMAHPFVTALSPVFGYDTQEKIDDFGRRAMQYKFGGS